MRYAGGRPGHCVWVSDLTCAAALGACILTGPVFWPALLPV